MASRSPGRYTTNLNLSILYYIRYAGDFIFGFTGSKKDAEIIMVDVIEFLTGTLKLKVNLDRSLIHHSGDRGIQFLGFYLQYLSNKQIFDKAKKDDNISQNHTVTIISVQLRVPIQLLLKRLIEKGYTKLRANGTYRSTSNRKLLGFVDKQIINHYSFVISNFMKYYLPANQYSDL
jgi:hypothetical protein